MRTDLETADAWTLDKAGDPTSAGWRDGDYIEAVDNILPMLRDDLSCYAEVCKVPRLALLDDVMKLILLDAPFLSKGDDDYLQCVTNVRDWLLEDVDAIARSFDVRFSVVLVDMLKVIIDDTPLADGFICTLADSISSEARRGAPRRPVERPT
jgi:hypothetical protein